MTYMSYVIQHLVIIMIHFTHIYAYTSIFVSNYAGTKKILSQL